MITKVFEKVGFWTTINGQDKLLIITTCEGCFSQIIADPDWVICLRDKRDNQKKPICEECYKKWMKIHKPENPMPFPRHRYYTWEQIEKEQT